MLIPIMATHPALKNHLILTGKPGSGKSTVVEKVSMILKKEGVLFAGFYTKECRNRGNRYGFDVIDLNTNSTAPLARISEMAKFEGPNVGKYIVDIKSFETAVKSTFSNFENLPRILILDEIGKMELLSTFFQNLIKDLFRKEPSFITLVTAPEKRAHLESVRSICELPTSRIVEVNPSNRDQLPQILARDIIQMHKNAN